MEDPFREELVRQLIGQAAESRGLDYKGPMAWAGSRAERAELIRDLMCFSNTPDGGYILVGVEEVLQAGTRRSHAGSSRDVRPHEDWRPREQLLHGSSVVLSPPIDARGKGSWASWLRPRACRRHPIRFASDERNPVDIHVLSGRSLSLASTPTPSHHESAAGGGVESGSRGL